MAAEKKVLMTNLWLADYSGSVLNCLSLGKTLSQLGYTVEVATLRVTEPILKHFDDARIPVRVIPGDKLSCTHYDLIWAHHTLLLDHLLFT